MLTTSSCVTEDWHMSNAVKLYDLVTWLFTAALYAGIIVYASGCSYDVTQEPLERRALYATEQSWYSHGLNVGCDVAELPVVRLDAKRFADLCFAYGVNECRDGYTCAYACLTDVQINEAAGLTTVVALAPKISNEDIPAAVAHEAAHYLSKCETGDLDRGHERAEVWGKGGVVLATIEYLRSMAL